METDVFLVSIIYWASVFAVLIWLSRRVSSLRAKLAKLEAEGKANED